MAYIKVNHRKMLSVAEQVDSYIVQLDNNMEIIDSTILSLSTEWKGEDYRQLKTEWNEINSVGSTTDKMKMTLKSYAGSIREASKLYKEAQARAINRANTLCK